MDKSACPTPTYFLSPAERHRQKNGIIRVLRASLRQKCAVFTWLCLFPSPLKNTFVRNNRIVILSNNVLVWTHFGLE